MDKSQNPPHILMDTTSTILTQVSGQTSVMVSLDTNTLIAACQGAAWKISGWPENIAIHHAKGCSCCHEYINHLLGAQSLGQINLQCIDVENAVQSTWPAFINSIKIDANQCIQGQLSDLHAHINVLGHICLYMHKSIQIYFGIFFDFILVLLSFHCSHTVPIFFSNFSLFFLPFYSLQKPVTLTWHC